MPTNPFRVITNLFNRNPWSRSPDTGLGPGMTPADIQAGSPPPPGWSPNEDYGSLPGTSGPYDPSTNLLRPGDTNYFGLPSITPPASGTPSTPAAPSAPSTTPTGPGHETIEPTPTWAEVASWLPSGALGFGGSGGGAGNPSGDWGPWSPGYQGDAFGFGARDETGAYIDVPTTGKYAYIAGQAEARRERSGNPAGGSNPLGGVRPPSATTPRSNVDVLGYLNPSNPLRNPSAGRGVQAFVNNLYSAPPPQALGTPGFGSVVPLSMGFGPGR